MVRDVTARRMLREKLEAMARDTSSPNEAAIARERLARMGDDDFEEHEFIMPWGDRIRWRTSVRYEGRYVGPPFEDE